MTKEVHVAVNNVPDYAHKYEWWVIRYCDGYMWFWGGFDDENRAIEAANEIGNGMVIQNNE